MTNRDHPLLIGCGIVGQSIATEHLSNGVSITVADIRRDAVETFLANATAQFPIRSNAPAQWAGLTTATLQFDCRDEPPIDLFQRPDRLMVIESIAEQLPLKEALFKALESEVSPKTIFCSNTSSIPIGRIAKSLRRPENVCGLHFFMPVEQRTTVEVIGAKQTGLETIGRASKHAIEIRKTPLLVRDTPCFVVNRLLTPYLNEALLMLGEGVSPAQLERSAMAYGMAMSPLRLLDTIGLATGFDAGRYFWQSFPHRISPSPILARLIKLQRKTDQAFRFLDPDSNTTTLARPTAEVVDRYQVATSSPVPPDDVTDRLMAVMAIEANVMKRQNVIDNDAVLDQAMTGGLGFIADRSWTTVISSLTDDRKRDLARRYGQRSASLVC